MAADEPARSSIYSFMTELVLTGERTNPSFIDAPKSADRVRSGEEIHEKPRSVGECVRGCLRVGRVGAGAERDVAAAEERRDQRQREHRRGRAGGDGGTP